MILNDTLLQRLVAGCAFLGSGGGGAIETGYHFVKVILKNTNGKGVELLSLPLSEEYNDLHACVVADIGAITAIETRQPLAIRNAFEVLDSLYLKERGKPLGAVLPFETGAENTLVPLVLASLKGVQVFDGDGGGRALPEIQLSTFASSGLTVCPASFANDRNDSVIANADRPLALDQLLRPLTDTPLFGDSASMAMFAGPLHGLAAGSVQGSITRAVYVGQLLEGIQTRNHQLTEEALEKVNQLQACYIAFGKVAKISEQVNDAFDYSTVTIVNAVNNQKIDIYTQNENLIAFVNGSAIPVACAPDSICYLKDDFSPVTNSEIKTGDVVYLINVLAHPLLRRAVSLQRFSGLLKNFGYLGAPESQATEVRGLGDLLMELGKKVM